MSTSHTTLTSAADERKSRLAKLASLKRKAPGSSTTISQSQPSSTSTDLPSQTTDLEEQHETASNPHLSGRNYDPSLRAPRLGFDASSTLLSPSLPTVESQSTTLLTSTLQTAHEEEAKLKQSESDPQGGAGGGLDLFKLQPKKPNWDLKRELAERMRRWDVEGKTQGAVARLVRERIEGRKREAREKEKAGIAKVVGEAEGPLHVEGEEVGIEGAELVEGVHLREREEEEEERRERELDEELEGDGVP